MRSEDEGGIGGCKLNCLGVNCICMIVNHTQDYSKQKFGNVKTGRLCSGGRCIQQRDGEGVIRGRLRGWPRGGRDTSLCAAEHKGVSVQLSCSCAYRIPGRETSHNQSFCKKASAQPKGLNRKVVTSAGPPASHVPVLCGQLARYKRQAFPSSRFQARACLCDGVADGHRRPGHLTTLTACDERRLGNLQLC